jgi:hypothetical protein
MSAGFQTSPQNEPIARLSTRARVSPVYRIRAELCSSSVRICPNGFPLRVDRNGNAGKSERQGLKFCFRGISDLGQRLPLEALRVWRMRLNERPDYPTCSAPVVYGYVKALRAGMRPGLVNNSKLRFVRNGYARFPPLRRILWW